MSPVIETAHTAIVTIYDQSILFHDLLVKVTSA